MSKGNVARLIKEPVKGTQFQLIPGQEVYILVGDRDDIPVGTVLECGSLEGLNDNYYYVRTERGVRHMYAENNLIGRRYCMFDNLGQHVEGKVFYNRKEVVDAEENLGYDILQAQNEQGLTLVSNEIQVWEVNEKMQKIGDKIVLD